MRRLLLYAPNVHTGGGLVLLRTLLASWPRSGVELTAFLDSRAREALPLPDGCSVHWVVASAASRLRAEFELCRQASAGDGVVFCFHGLPPILPSRTKVLVFQQNRNYLGLNALSAFSWRTRIRLALERLVARSFRGRVSTYIVQTPTMKRQLIAWYRRGRRSEFVPDVRVFPFMDDLTLAAERPGSAVGYDFVYVADGEAHKNHRTLLQAWALLADEGLRPTLALTLTSRDGKLRAEVESARQARNLAIVDLGHMPRGEILALYERARALIFPSTSESLGLPLIEASRVGLPILAGELDYVRDVCTPQETFDPDSPVSIARAVKRFLGSRESPILPCSSTVFWERLLLLTSGESNEIVGS
jgi:glycosyltransferase involved in cell wall biosynthesis